MVDKLGPFVGTDFVIFFLLYFFTFLPVTLNLAYFAPLNGAGRIFSVNFNYQRCLKNSKMVNFWLTSWVTLWRQIFKVFFLHFLPRTRVRCKQSLNNARPKYSFYNPATFLETRGKKLIDIWPPFCLKKFLTRTKLWFRKKYQFSRRDFLLISWQKHVVPMFYQYCDYIFFPLIYS